MQCSGSMTFCCGSGSCYFRHWPSRGQQKTNFLQNFFCLLLFEGTFTSFFKDKKFKRSHKTVRIKVLWTLNTCIPRISASQKLPRKGFMRHTCANESWDYPPPPPPHFLEVGNYDDSVPESRQHIRRVWRPTPYLTYLGSTCTLYSLAETPQLLPSPCIWARIWGRYWSAKIEDISFYPPGLSATNVNIFGWHEIYLSGWSVWPPMSKSQQNSGLNPSIFRHSGIWGAAKETVLNKVYKKPKNPPVEYIWRQHEKNRRNLLGGNFKKSAELFRQFVFCITHIPCLKSCVVLRQSLCPSTVYPIL